MRVLVLTHQDYTPPKDIEKLTDKEIAPWKTEYDVITALDHLGHEQRTLGAATELRGIRETLSTWKPHIVFNLLEEFGGEGVYVPYLLGSFEIGRQPFTGCNASSLLFSDSKVLSKKILRYHRIPVPNFVLFPQGRAVRRPKKLSFPLIVKSATEHGSAGIAQASLVDSDEKLKERVEFVHHKLETDAIAEEYIDGRELYVGVFGNRRLETFPVWEMHFEKLTPGAAKIATAKVKWDLDYQSKIGLKTKAATDLSSSVKERISRMAKRVYRILGLNGYARMDFRLTEDDKLYLLEPNPNPDLAHDEDFAASAKAVGIDYERLIQRILNLGIRYHTEWKR